MAKEKIDHNGHRIEIAGKEEPTVLIDGEPVRWGRLDDGSYYLHEFAYEPADSLAEVAKRYVDHLERAKKLKSARGS